MPKMKTHSGAKKRFSRTASGRIRFKKSKMRHILEKKSKKMKRKARRTAYLSPQDARQVARLLPYSK